MPQTTNTAVTVRSIVDKVQRNWPIRKTVPLDGPVDESIVSRRIANAQNAVVVDPDNLIFSGNWTFTGNIIWTGSPTFANLTVTGTSTLALIGATSTTKEHALILTTSGSPSETQANVLSLRQNNANADSALRFLDNNGHEHGAVGYGNTGQGSTWFFNGRTYAEASDIDGTGASAEYVIVQTSTFQGALGSVAASGRIHLDSYGSLFIYPIGVTGANAGAAYADVAYTWSTPGVSNGVITQMFGNYPNGAAQAIVACEDLNTSIRFRFNAYNSGAANALLFTSYGDTLANSGGYIFLSGGAVASQTKKFQIANDGVTSSVPFGIPAYTVSGLPTPAAAGFLAYVTDNTLGITAAVGLAPHNAGSGSNKVPVFYNGSGWLCI